MLLNWSAVRMRAFASDGRIDLLSRADGRSPSWPTATCAFWPWIARCTSSGVSWKVSSLPGSSQMRIEYCDPNICTSPTPSTRLIGSAMLLDR
jgi:hypothetical protein